MTKRTNLADALQKAAGKSPPSPLEQPESSTQGDTSPQPVPPSRQGKKAITGHFDPAVSRQLKQIAVENDSTVQALLAEALNGLFEKYGRSPIA